MLTQLGYNETQYSESNFVLIYEKLLNLALVQGADYKMQQIENSNFSTSADHKEMN